jgi:hypothetical protein
MDFIVAFFFTFLFLAIAVIELKTGKALFRPFVTRESMPIWYWLEISVSLFLGLGLVISAFN